MKTYRVVVDGQAHEVTVEEIQPASGAPERAMPSARPAVPVKPAAPASQGSQKPAAAQVITVAQGERPIPAPMPGKILAVNVVPGDTVTAGTVLLVLEAMKMENDILAPMDGKVKIVKVHNGDMVDTGDLMLVLE
jgi:glutaconyl-CoA decarboxylase